MHFQITYGNTIEMQVHQGKTYTWPKTVQGPASGTMRTLMNSASFTMLSARKWVRYSARSFADFICCIADTVNGVDKPVPRCTMLHNVIPGLEKETKNSKLIHTNFWKKLSHLTMPDPTRQHDIPHMLYQSSHLHL